MNKVILTGRTTRDLELKYTPSEKAVAQFTLAVNKRGKNDLADFITCEVWERTAEVMSMYVRKGHKVGIIGRIKTDSYEDSQGQRKYVTKVVVEELEFLESKKDSQQSDGFEHVNDDELPF